MGEPIKMKASAKELTGFAYRFCGGAARPGRGIAVPRGANNFLEFFVVDGEEDPVPDQLDGFLAIGQKTLRDMQTDPEIHIYAADALQVADAVTKSKVLETENADLKAQLAALQAKLAASESAPLPPDTSKGKGK